MKQIEQTYEIKAPISKVWEALTSQELAEAWGAGPAIVNAIIGGEFSYWDGDIHGKFTKLDENTFIEQDWFGHDHPERKFNVSFSFEDSGDTTLVHLLYVGEIEDEAKDKKDWKVYYFDPIKQLLEK